MYIHIYIYISVYKYILFFCIFYKETRERRNQRKPIYVLHPNSLQLSFHIKVSILNDYPNMNLN